jgi:hypothetical protein
MPVAPPTTAVVGGGNNICDKLGRLCIIPRSNSKFPFKKCRIQRGGCDVLLDKVG